MHAPPRETQRAPPPALTVDIAAAEEAEELSTSNGWPFTPPPLLTPNVRGAFGRESNDVDDVIHQMAAEFALEDKHTSPAREKLGAAQPPPPAPVPLASPPPSSKRPQLRLKLEDMPTSQQAEDRAQRAATRLIAKREAMEKEMEASAGSGDDVAAAASATKASSGVSATQHALLRLNFKSYSSGEDSDLQSPSGACEVQEQTRQLLRSND